MPQRIETRLGNIHLEHEPEGWFFSIITFDHYSIAGNNKPLQSREEAVEEAKIILEAYEQDPEPFRD